MYLYEYSTISKHYSILLPVAYQLPPQLVKDARKRLIGCGGRFHIFRIVSAINHCILLCAGGFLPLPGHGKSDGSLLPIGLALESLDLPVGELSEILVFVLDDHNLAFAADEQHGDHDRVQDRHDEADNKDNDQDKTVERN